MHRPVAGETIMLEIEVAGTSRAAPASGALIVRTMIVQSRKSST